MNLERELKELKAVIRSLLISHTNQRMTIAELQGDFQRNEGCPIPFAKFGYDSVLKLLKSLPDVVQVWCENNCTYVKAISTPAVQHVEQLVRITKEKRKARSNRVCLNEKSRSFQTNNRYISQRVQYPLKPQNTNTVEAQFINRQTKYIAALISEASSQAFQSKEKNKHTTFDDKSDTGKAEIPPVRNNLSISRESCEHVNDSFTSFSNVWQWVSMMNVPVNSVKLSSTIAKVRASDYFTIAENEIVSIMYILNPNRIWLRSVKQDQIISKLQREMNQFYNNIGSKYLCLEASKALHGLYCAVLYQDYWYRARIVGPLVGRRIKVNFIDIGIVELVELGNMKFLADIFDAIPAQAIRGSLAYLMPPSNAWNIETSEALSYLLTFEDFLSAYVVNIDHDLNTVDVVLHNKRGDIINKYFASIISAHWTGDNYLSQKLEDYQRRNRTFNERYPTFFCIEDGHYPTRCEILDAYKSNIYFEEFYTHITHVEGNNIVEQISKLTNEKMAQTFGIEIHKHPTEDKIYESD